MKFYYVSILLLTVLITFCWRTESVAASEPNQHLRRVISIGDLPADHDPSLVLRKGRIITVRLVHDIRGEIPSEGERSLRVHGRIYDDTNQVFLLPGGTTLRSRYRISEEQGKIKVNITVMEVELDLRMGLTARFSDPLYHRRSSFGVRVNLDEILSSAEENLRLREQLFQSPVIGAELVLGAESEDRTSLRGQVIFSENALGNRTIAITAGYMFNLQVGKDILLSGPYVGDICWGPPPWSRRGPPTSNF